MIRRATTRTRGCLALLAATLLVLSGCGIGTATPSDGGTDAHLVSNFPLTYTETAETTNGDTAGAEPTLYALDHYGLVVTGAFEAANPSADCFVFSTGDARFADVAVFVALPDGQALTERVSISLDAIDDDGIPPFVASDAIDDAIVPMQEAWRVCVSTVAAEVAGRTYTIEMRNGR